jgi:tRNA G18 (ribose-2'-O)-methylase SpoU
VESLNVAVATGLMLGEYSRLHGIRDQGGSD